MDSRKFEFGFIKKKRLEDKIIDMILRALEPEDLDVLYTVENDESLWTCGGTTVPYSRYALSQYIATSLNNFYQDKQLRLVMDADGQVVGLVDLFNYSAQHQRAEVGIVVCDAFRKKGYGASGLRLLQQYVMNHLSDLNLYALVSVDNLSAQRLFLKAGFEATATLKQWVRSCNKGREDVILFQLLQNTFVKNRG